MLLAEDNRINQQIFRVMLQNMGWRNVTVVSNGEEAVRAVCRACGKESREEAFAVVFMDVQMPVLDGLQATRTLRASPLRVQPLIVALTASDSSEQWDECRRAGMDDHLGKPIKLEALKASLERAAVAARLTEGSVRS